MKKLAVLAVFLFLMLPVSAQTKNDANQTGHINKVSSEGKKEPIKIMAVKSNPDDEDTDVSDKKKEVLIELANLPEFVDGVDSLKAYLARNTYYPLEAAKHGIEGRAMVSFIVEGDGTISNAEVVNKNEIDPLLAKEAIRVIMSMPKWIPAVTTKGETVRVKNFAPITFSLK